MTGMTEYMADCGGNTVLEKRVNCVVVDYIVLKGKESADFIAARLEALRRGREEVHASRIADWSKDRSRQTVHDLIKGYFDRKEGA